MGINFARGLTAFGSSTLSLSLLGFVILFWSVVSCEYLPLWGTCVQLVVRMMAVKIKSIFLLLTKRHNVQNEKQ